MPFIQLLVSLSLAGLIWLALGPTFLGSTTTGTFVAFISAAAMMAKPLRQLSEISAVLQRGLAAAGDMFDLLDQTDEPDPGQVVPGPFESLRLSQVGFRYPNATTEALRGIDLELKPGRVVALAGPSGSGKTTVAALISRFYAPSEGAID